jgi:ATP-dependent protease ClpP protease subunit
MDKNTILIDGVIGKGVGEVSSSMIRDMLASADPSKPLTIILNSEGGSVFEALTCYDMIKAFPSKKIVRIESVAFSAASFLAMVGDEIVAASNSYLMLHAPYVEASGDAKALTENAALLSQLQDNMAQIYAEKTGKTVEEMQTILARESYYNATQALQAGLVTSVAPSQRVISRQLAKMNRMPHGVVAALFGAGSGGEQSEPTKEQSMSESQPVAATLDEIEAAFPKAKSDFVLACLKKKLPMASVAQAAVEEMMSENQELMAKVSAMEQELAKYKSMEVVEEEPAAMETEEDEPEEMAKAPVAKRRGLKPVAVPRRSSAATAKKQWDDAVAENLSKFKGDRAKAVMAANRSNPGLREQMLAEINAR